MQQHAVDLTVVQHEVFHPGGDLRIHRKLCLRGAGAVLTAWVHVQVSGKHVMYAWGSKSIGSSGRIIDGLQFFVFQRPTALISKSMFCGHSSSRFLTTMIANAHFADKAMLKKPVQVSMRTDVAYM